MAMAMAEAAAATSSALIRGFRTPPPPPPPRSFFSSLSSHCLFASWKPLVIENHPGASLLLLRPRGFVFTTCASISASPLELRSPADRLSASILSKVAETDRGVSLSKEESNELAELARELQTYCISEPVKCPLIFGEWDVVYCSRPTSPGGGYRSGLGRLVFKTKEMIQVVSPPNTVINKVSFSALGFIDGEVSLKGTLKVLDDKWIQVVFEPPELKFGTWDFKYGGESEVKLEITYVDENIRLGKGSRGSLFVFQRRKQPL